MDNKALACKVASRYHTNNPFIIAEELGIILISAPLNEIRGLRQLINRRIVLYINSNLDEQQQRLVCAHELGHQFLHKGMNRIFMDRCTHMVAGKYEKEAHQFSVDLIYTDEELQPFLSRPISDAANYMGVSLSLAEYRMHSVEPNLFYSF